MRTRLLVVLAVLLLTGALLIAGLFWVDTKVVHGASLRLDPVCMRYEKRHHVPYWKRVQRCTIHKTVISGGSGNKGKGAVINGLPYTEFKWQEGNFFWNVNVDVWARPVPNPDGSGKFLWDITSPECWVGHSWIYGTSIDSCGNFLASPDGSVWKTGLTWQVSCCLVSAGWRSFWYFGDDGTNAGPVLTGGPSS